MGKIVAVALVLLGFGTAAAAIIAVVVGAVGLVVLLLDAIL